MYIHRKDNTSVLQTRGELRLSYYVIPIAIYLFIVFTHDRLYHIL